MMKIYAYILAIAAAFAVWSCSFAEMDPSAKIGSDGKVQFVPRIMPFGDIETKANKTAEEQKVYIFSIPSVRTFHFWSILTTSRNDILPMI